MYSGTKLFWPKIDLLVLAQITIFIQTKKKKKDLVSTERNIIHSL